MDDYARELGLNPNITLRALDVDSDIETVYPWFRMDYAAFWNMQDMSFEETRQFYNDVQKGNQMNAFLGLYKNQPSFLMECYWPRYDPIGKHYPVQEGDIGMHFIVGPAETRIPGFTRDVLRHIMAFLFYRCNARRVVVEPDVRNEKVHTLNTFVGFTRERIIQLEEKQAYLGFCCKEDFINTLEGVNTSESV